MNRAPSVPDTVITIMSAGPFRVQAQPVVVTTEIHHNYKENFEPNACTARLVGFDNAVEDNPDQCDFAYKTE